MKQLDSNWANFHEILYLSIFKKSVLKIQVSLKSNKSNGYVDEEQNTYLIISRSVLLKMRNVLDKFVETTETHILCSINLFSKILPFMR